MQPFTTHCGIVATVDRANVDTDAIIPKQYLKSISRLGFETGFFSDWRYNTDGSPNADFELNRPEFEGASILLTRNNFGCGSSREHAVWAVVQYGFRVVIAPWREDAAGRVPGFADIFRGNSIRNGLLCIELPPETVESFFVAVRADPGLEAAVDLAKQTVSLPAGAAPVRFEIDAAAKNILLEGLDDIAQTLLVEGAITEFEKRHDVQMA